MARKEVDEMETYRNTATRSRVARRGGKRKTDKSVFFTVGWILEAVFLMLMAIWAFSACVGRIL